jgi:hypothetical protein
MDELPLTTEECRVLGSLIEKAATTPDQYPLSSNGLRTACNQKTARDPVVSYDERLVDATLLSLRDKGLARTIRGAGQRVFKHKHIVDEAWGLDPSQLAVLAVLMLRGPQSAGELRSRTERAHGFATTDGVDAVLDDLARRDPPLVRMIGRQAGQRDDRWVTTALPGVAPDSPPAVASDGAALAAPAPLPETVAAASVAPEPQPFPSSAVASPQGRPPAGGPDVEALRREVAELRRLVERVCGELGISTDEGAG